MNSLLNYSGKTGRQNKSQSGNSQRAENVGASELNEGEPILGFLAPGGAKSAPLGEAREGALHHPAPCRVALLGGHLDRERFIAPRAVFDMRDVMGDQCGGEHIGIIVAAIRAQMLASACDWVGRAGAAPRYGVSYSSDRHGQFE